MKRLIVGAALIALAGGASADWEMERDGAVLRSEGAPFEVFMPAPGVRTIPLFSKSLIRVKDADDCLRKQYPPVMGALSDAYPSVSINGAKVRSRAICKVSENTFLQIGRGPMPRKKSQEWEAGYENYQRVFPSGGRSIHHASRVSI